MSQITHVTAKDVRGKLNWTDVVEALKSGHHGPRAQLSDQLLTRGADNMLSRAAWIDGLGTGVKSVTLMADNAAKGLPSVHGAMLVFDDVTGEPTALIDNDVITTWKTAADSALGARLLARAESRNLLIIGAGAVAASLIEAYSEIFPELSSIQIWNRTRKNAVALAEKMAGKDYSITVADDLEIAAGSADIICTATLTSEPILRGDWVQPGTHVDLIGAYKPDMREADDDLIGKSRLFVDCFETTIDHIGELMIPISESVISRDAVLGDLYDLVGGQKGRLSDEDITVFKNGGGAHLDLMVANHILGSLENTIASNENDLHS